MYLRTIFLSTMFEVIKKHQSEGVLIYNLIISFLKLFSTTDRVHVVPDSKEEVDLFEFQAVLNCLDAGPTMSCFRCCKAWKLDLFQGYGTTPKKGTSSSSDISAVMVNWKWSMMWYFKNAYGHNAWTSLRGDAENHQPEVKDAKAAGWRETNKNPQVDWWIGSQTLADFTIFNVLRMEKPPDISELLVTHQQNFQVFLACQMSFQLKQS